MKHSLVGVGLVALGLVTAGGSVGIVAGGDEPKGTAGAAGPTASTKASFVLKESALAERLDHLKSDYQAAVRTYQQFYRGSTIPKEEEAKAAAFQPDFAAVVRRIADVATTAPNDPAVRDAMLWVIEHSANGGPYAGEFAIASTWLVRYFGDDPDAIRVGLTLDNWVEAYRDNLLLCFFASAKSRESQGLARLALAQFLERKATVAEWAKTMSSRPTYTHDDLVRADGTLYSETEIMPDDDYAYRLNLRQCDVNYLRSEAERLYEEVIAKYTDVPYLTSRDRLLEALLKRPEPHWNGKPLKDEDRERMSVAINRRKSTLGRVAEARLDAWRGLAVGEPAREIEGVDVHGKALRLSEYRGKVVVLVFWATWCGPCVREIPREKGLVERMKGRPFAMLGINCDGGVKDARSLIESRGVTWPNWYDDPEVGKIAKLYHVRGYPTVYVIDAKGMIRGKNALGGSLDRLVEGLVVEQEAAQR